MTTQPERSPSIAELAKALTAFQGAIRSVPKRSVNPGFRSKYADLDAVWEVCRQPLFANGLSVVQLTMQIDDHLYLETLVLHISGEYISGCYPITPMRQTQAGWALANDPQSIGSAITYARRYAMSAILGISADEDDDGERATRAPRPSARPPGAVRTPVRLSPQEDAPARPPSRAAQPQPKPTAGGMPPAPVKPGDICDEHNRPWGRMPDRGIGHPMGAGNPWHIQGSAQTSGATIDATDSPSAEVPPTFNETPLGQFQREIFDYGMGWTNFESMVLHMPWEDWIKLKGTIAEAREYWIAWNQQQENQPEG